MSAIITKTVYIFLRVMLSPPRLPASWVGFHAGASGAQAAPGPVCEGSDGTGNRMQSHAPCGCMA